ncbi:MAG: RNA polymerase sigma factor [Spirochaetaceae bacterium]|jgi:RNA polymerase sigma-70 factor (ECF subfamily)|nr:RNA polymerase sigma factor [Spirochaetaceae bacterium]
MNSDVDTEEVFDDIYHQFFPVLVKIVYRITGSVSVSEDLCQEAFIRYYERRDKLPGGDQAKFWLIRVVKNLAYNHEKRKGRERLAYEKYYHEPKKVESNGGEKLILEDESKKAVQEALLKIPYKLRMVLILKEYGGLDYKEIAASLKISEGNVKVRVFRARKLLGEYLGKGEIYVP